jgi:hypothetical protein
MQQRKGTRPKAERGKGERMQELVRWSNGSGFEQTFKNIDDVLWKESGCTTELDYTEQSSWILFLKYLDDLEHERALKASFRESRMSSSSTRSIAG